MLDIGVIELFEIGQELTDAAMGAPSSDHGLRPATCCG